MMAEFCYEHVQAAGVKIVVVAPKSDEQRTGLDHSPCVATEPMENFRLTVREFHRGAVGMGERLGQG